MKHTKPKQNAENRRTVKSFLDPRTKLVLLITLPTFLMGGAGGEEMRPFLILFPLLALSLLLASGNLRAAVLGTAAFAGAELLWRYAAPCLGGAPYFILYLLYRIILGLVPCALTAIYAMTTTTVSEFITGMERLHIPRLITIPLSVMFRFFPTVREEANSINNAMRMRGIRFGGEGSAKMLEYRFIPVMLCSLRIGDELSAASLTRGLGAPVKRTSICRIGFHVQDMLVLTLCGSAFAVWLLGVAGVSLW